METCTDCYKRLDPTDALPLDDDRTICTDCAADRYERHLEPA